MMVRCMMVSQAAVQGCRDTGVKHASHPLTHYSSYCEVLSPTLHPDNHFEKAKGLLHAPHVYMS